MRRRGLRYEDSGLRPLRRLEIRAARGSKRTTCPMRPNPPPRRPANCDWPRKAMSPATTNDPGVRAPSRPVPEFQTHPIAARSLRGQRALQNHDYPPDRPHALCHNGYHSSGRYSKYAQSPHTLGSLAFAPSAEHIYCAKVTIRGPIYRSVKKGIDGRTQLSRLLRR